MNEKNKGNVAASVRQRLLNISRESGEDFNLILTRYGLERMLYRLSQSTWREKFLLKGAMLFSVWHDDPHRPTRDVDLLGFIAPEIDEIKSIFESLCSIDVDDDGLVFDTKSIRVEEIRENNAYDGIRTKLTGTLEKARIILQVDIGFGDVVTPAPEEIDYPTLLDQQAPKLRAYPIYTVIAEKFEAMVKLGMINTRMKDFYDLWMSIEKFEIDGELLAQAISATFNRRQTALPDGIPLAFTEEFFDDSLKNTQWDAFLRKNSIDKRNDLNHVVHCLKEFLMPVIISINSGRKMRETWSPTNKWISNSKY